MAIPIQLAVEDSLSEAVLRAIIKYSGRDYLIGACYCRGGVGYIKSRITGYNKAAKGIPIVVLVDLDDSECPPILVRRWLPNGVNHNLIFRVAVTEVEAWLLADKTAISSFLGINKKFIPDNPDSIADPKRFLIQIARKSRKGELRRSLVPIDGSTAQIGPDYNGKLIDYIDQLWDPARACVNSPSLERACCALKSFNPLYEPD